MKYHNTSFIFIVVMVIIFQSMSLMGLAQQNTNFGIYFPPNFPEEVKTDVITLLKNTKQFQWKILSTEKEVKQGIILRIDNTYPFKTKESYHFQNNGTGILVFSSISINGLVFGIYKYLHSQGFRFYLPDDLYTILPSQFNLFSSKKDYVDQPFTQIRDFFGTGGFGSGLSDTDRSVEKAWNLWKLRNGFGAAYELAGHRGENFILENNDVLLKHRDWLVLPKITNGKIDPSTKLNYQNKEAVDFYTSWSLQPFTSSNFKLPPPAITQFVSMEPSDGGGYLNPITAQTKNLPSISDQVFGAANIAASKLDKMFPDHRNLGVNLYAYSSHAEPPSFKLNPRVFVQIIPYQFQNIAFGPSFIKMWAAKAKRFGLYDYFKYPDSQWDLPGGISLKESMKRLIYSVKNGSEGTTYESSYSKFSTGIPLWVMVRYLADGESDWQSNIDRLIRDLYPGVEEPVRQLFDLMYNDPTFSQNSITNSIRLIDKATSSSHDQKVLARLEELKKYFYYIHLVFSSRNLSNGSLKDRLVPVADYAWKIYKSGIIDSYRIMQLVSYSFLNSDKSDPQFSAYQKLHVGWFPETLPKDAIWSKIPQSLPKDLIEQHFQVLRKKYTTPVTTATYSFKTVQTAMAGKYKPKREFTIGGSYLNRGYFGIHCDKPTEIKIHYKLINEKQAPKLVISGIDKEYSTPIAFTIDKALGDITIKIPAGETTIFMNASTYTTYRFTVKISDGLVFFDGSPRQILPFYKDFNAPADQNTYDPQFYPSYIFFPSGVTSVQYNVQLNQLQIFNPSQQKISTKLLQEEPGGSEIREISLSEAETGKIWKATVSGNFNYSFINIPDRYFLLEKKD